MNKHDFMNEMDRVLAFYQRPDEEKQPGEFKDYGIWIDEIFKKVCWIESIKFRLVIDALLDVRPRYRKDLDHRRILSVYNDLAEKNGWKREEQRHCPDCKGIRFVDVWLKDKSGREFKAVKGCSNCNAACAGVHADFTVIDAPDSAPVDKRAIVRKIPPAMAQCLLGIADRAGLNVPEDLVEDLIEAANQPDAKDYRPKKYNDAKRKNELVLGLVKSSSVPGEAEREASVVSQPVDVVEVGSSPPPAQAPELSAEDLADIPF